ncbi:tetratricopeptide repeat protein [uncultured Tenacibaculum sp.]|uniref:tetratricopeptide repeat protein n=1 Tax=uncultured Tenacibaculum sp. TaxID=174713 RepID=UPI002611D7E8|nr:tetratricopeptide repeat protein [uncultured Tenacibaculum sp.]
MKRILLALLMCCAVLHVNAQEDFNKLIEVGISNHDKGRYQDAIKYYKKALELKPESHLANYEISLSYMSLKDYKNAIKYSEKVLSKSKDERLLLPAYVNKASALDMMGKTKKSIRIFEKAIKKLGGHYLLHFNLAVNYLKLNDLKNAEIHLQGAIKNNPFHTSSHFYLAKINDAQGNKVQALLASYYFLFIEPESIRAQEIYAILKKNIKAGVKKEDGKNITINLSSMGGDADFSAAELMLSMLEASRNLEENKGKTDEEMFVENTKSFFGILGELKEDSKKEGFWWDFYVTFYDKLAKSEHMEAYCNFVTQMDLKSKRWIDDNEEKMKSFLAWLEKELK